MECSDNAGLLSILAAAEGITLSPLELRSQTGEAMWTNPVYPAGNTVCQVSAFSFHAVGSLTNVFDVSVRCPEETSSGNCNDLSTTCQMPGALFTDMGLEQYLPLVFQQQTISNTSAVSHAATICEAVNP